MIIVSACLAGINCRYNGGSCVDPAIAELVRQGKAIAACPELLGGLPMPRPSCEIQQDPEKGLRVVSKDGRDCTQAYKKGAKKMLALARAIGAKRAIFKSRSPSCGVGLIYDGTFSGKLICGNGITTELMIGNGIQVFSENDFHQNEMAALAQET